MREIFDYTPLPDGTAALARAYGDNPVLALPEALPGPGGPLPLTKLGGYCFAETVRDAPRGALLRCVREEDGVLRPVLPGSVPEEGLHPAAGRFLEEVATTALQAIARKQRIRHRAQQLFQIAGRQGRLHSVPCPRHTNGSAGNGRHKNATCAENRMGR